MKPYLQNDFARDIVDNLRMANQKSKHTLLRSSEIEVDKWFRRKENALPEDFTETLEGAMFLDEENDHVNTSAFLSGARYLQSNDTFQSAADTVILEAIIPTTPDNDTVMGTDDDRQWLPYFPETEYSPKNLYALHEKAEPNYEANSDVMSVMKLFSALTFQDKATALHAILTESWTDYPADFLYPPAPDNPDDQLTQDPTPKPFTNHDNGIRFDNEEEETLTLPTPQKSSDFSKYSFYFPVCNFVEVALKFAQATDLITGVVNTRYAKSFLKTALAARREDKLTLKTLYNKSERAGISAIPILRIRGDKQSES